MIFVRSDATSLSNLSQMPMQLVESRAVCRKTSCNTPRAVIRYMSLIRPLHARDITCAGGSVARQFELCT